MGYKSCLSKGKLNGTGRATAYPLKLKLTRSLIDCLNQHGSSGGHLCNQTETWIGFEALLKSISAQGQNAIRSDEAFSRMYHSDDNLHLLQSTLTRSFRVRVVVVYRRYHEWLLSLHNEIHKTVSRRPHFQLWPQNGGIPLESFRDFYRRVVKGVAWIDGKEGVDKEKNIWYLRAAEKENIHASKYLQRVFGQYFDDVVVFNMNQNGSLVSNFIEGMLPVAKEVINDLEKAPQKRYPSTVLDYDMLAVAAHDKGLLQRNSTRRDIRRAIAAVLPPNLTLILPRVCISPLEESAFLNRSMLFERQMFGEHSLDSRHDFETSFAKASRGLKFCNVDTEAVLTNRSLQEFFRSL